VRTMRPVATSQSFRVLSVLPESTVRPSGANATPTNPSQDSPTQAPTRAGLLECSRTMALTS
jgi:hypothetical protein